MWLGSEDIEKFTVDRCHGYQPAFHLNFRLWAFSKIVMSHECNRLDYFGSVVVKLCIFYCDCDSHLDLFNNQYTLIVVSEIYIDDRESCFTLIASC